MRAAHCIVYALVLGVALAALPALAKPPKPQPTITEVFVDFENEAITISGEYLDGGEAPIVLLGDDPTPLTLISYSDSQTVVELPPGLSDGDYRLTVSTGRSTDTYDLTIGAVGPQGEPGEPGVEGPAGSGARLADRDGKIIGIPMNADLGGDSDGDTWVVFNEELGLTVALGKIWWNGLVGGGLPVRSAGDIAYPQGNCQGQPYYYNDKTYGLVGVSGLLLVTQGSEGKEYWASTPGNQLESVNLVSRKIPDGRCISLGVTMNTPRLYRVDALPFPDPVPVPLQVISVP